MTSDAGTEWTGHQEAAQLANLLLESLIGAATAGQIVHGRGVLWSVLDAGTLTWTFKPLSDSSGEFDDWPALRSIVERYDPRDAVVIALIGGGAQFFTLPIETEDEAG